MRCGSTSSRCCHRLHPGPAAASRAGCPTATVWPRSASWPARPRPGSCCRPRSWAVAARPPVAPPGGVGQGGVFEQLQALLLDEHGEAGRVDLERVSVASFSLRAVKGGPDRRQSDRSRQGRVQAPPTSRRRRRAPAVGGGERGQRQRRHHAGGGAGGYPGDPHAHWAWAASAGQAPCRQGRATIAAAANTSTPWRCRSARPSASTPCSSHPGDTTGRSASQLGAQAPIGPTRS